MVVQYATLSTDIARIAFVREKLMTSDQWILKGLYTIFQFQTEDEKNSESTHYYNNVGFSGIDGELMTSFAKQIIRKGYVQALETKQPVTVSMYFSPKQETILRKKICKYARQLVRVTKGQQ